MAVNCSTAFRERILGPSAIETILNYGCVEVRTGPQPANADMPATGTLIGRITNGGGAWSEGVNANGLRYERIGNGIVSAHPTQEWILTGLSNGIAGWFRLRANPPDPGELSTVHARIDGAVGELNAFGDFQLLLPSLSVAPGTTIVIPTWFIAIPPLTFN